MIINKPATHKIVGSHSLWVAERAHKISSNATPKQNYSNKRVKLTTLDYTDHNSLKPSFQTKPITYYNREIVLAKNGLSLCTTPTAHWHRFPGLKSPILMILDTYYMRGKPRIRKLKKIVSQKKKKILASPFTDRAAFGFG